MHTMSTSDSSTPAAEAAGYLLSELAATLHTAVEVTHEAIQSPRPAALLVALAAMLEKAGAMADRGGQACGQPAMQRPDGWLLSPLAGDKLGLLEGGRPVAADGAAP